MKECENIETHGLEREKRKRGNIENEKQACKKVLREEQAGSLPGEICHAPSPGAIN